jgi:YHS domain-containing protein
LAVRLVGEVGGRHGVLAVRVGLHTGSAVERDGDWYGAAVNLAARVAAAAERGQVLMTAATHAAAGDALQLFRLERLPPQAFKNVSEPVQLYALTLAAQRETASLPVDPVCHMAVDPSRATVQRTYEGRELLFCSSGCARVFDRHPDHYAQSVPPRG